MLLVGGKSLAGTANSPFDLVTLLLSHPSIEAAANAFSQKKRLRFENEQRRLLHVFQREYATLNTNNQNRVDFLGSHEATSCVILFFRSKLTGKSSTAHFDGTEGQIGGPNCSLLHILSSYSIEERNFGLTLDLVGGFHDEESEESTVVSLIEALDSLEEKFEVRLAFLWKYNTDYSKDVPIFRGAAMEMSSGEVFPVEEWPDKGVESLVRSLRFLSHPPLANVFDQTKELLWIAPFEYDAFSTKHLDIFERMNDEQLLEILSTTPHAESPDYCVMLRECFKFQRKFPTHNDYFKGLPKVYALSPEGVWEALGNNE